MINDKIGKQKRSHSWPTQNTLQHSCCTQSEHGKEMTVGTYQSVRTSGFSPGFREWGASSPRAWEISGYMSLLWFHWGYAETKLSCRMRSSFICMIHPAWLFPAHIIFSKTQEPKRGKKWDECLIQELCLLSPQPLQPLPPNTLTIGPCDTCHGSFDSSLSFSSVQRKTNTKCSKNQTFSSFLLTHVLRKACNVFHNSPRLFKKMYSKNRLVLFFPLFLRLVKRKNF